MFLCFDFVNHILSVWCCTDCANIDACIALVQDQARYEKMREKFGLSWLLATKYN